MDEAVDIAEQVAAGLAVAHAQGIVHRDIKPGNIMLVGQRQAKIMDFGIARMKTSDVRTQSGTMMGSPKYMSPEQVGGHPVDARSDIFSLGSVLYEMLTGRPGLRGREPGAAAQRDPALHPAALSQHRRACPTMLELVVARAMQKNPQARYQDAGEMARDLAQCRIALARTRAARRPRRRRRPIPYASTAPRAASAERGDGGAGGWPRAAVRFGRGLRRLLADRSGEPRLRKPPTRPARGGWSLAYCAAALGALVIAFG
jgi:serine/threonine-protein kinase